MADGQPLDGELTISNLTQQLAAEGVKHIVIVSDNTRLHAAEPNIAAGVKIYPRRKFDRVQTDLREVKGVSVLIYDQMCATEKRRQIKRLPISILTLAKIVVIAHKNQTVSRWFRWIRLWDESGKLIKLPATMTTDV